MNADTIHYYLALIGGMLKNLFTDHTTAMVAGIVFFILQVIMVILAIGHVKSVGSSFNLGNKPRRGGSTEEARPRLSQFKSQLGRNTYYEYLKRLGVTAPLLGVIITALSIALKVVPDEAMVNEPEQIMLILPALYSGVLAGALLAIINQFFLVKVTLQMNKYVGLFEDKYSMQGAAASVEEGMSETVVQVNVLTSKTGEAIATIDEILEKLKTRLEAAHNQIAQEMNSVASACGDASTKIERSATEFHTRLSKTAETFHLELHNFHGRMNEAAEEFLKSNQNLAQGAARQLDSVKASVESLKKVDDAVKEKLQELNGGVARFVESGKQFNEVTKTMETRVTESMDSNREAVRGMNLALQEEVKKSNQHLAGLSTQLGSFEQSFTATAGSIKSTSDNMETASVNLGQLAAQVLNSIKSIFTDNAQEITEAAAKIKSASSAFDISAQQLVTSTEGHKNEVAQVRQIVVKKTRKPRKKAEKAKKPWWRPW